MATLGQIEHIVVLMLENRSFDHMLGYLTRDANPHPVDGLTGGEVNIYEHAPGHQIQCRPFVLKQPVFKLDPHHGYANVEVQLESRDGQHNTGFVKDFTDKALPKGIHPGAIMGYYDKDLVPAYDHLARHYAVCDRWFASVPGPTWPNRYFALCGHSKGSVVNVRLQDIPTIFDHLDVAHVPWGYYSHDIGFLRTVRRYTGSVGKISKVSEFYERASEGTLPAVSWVDPNFTLQEHVFGKGYSNDDHPPADIRRGQRLVARIYNYLLLGRNDAWKKTLFIVVYDEHGGFYDHVPPEPAVAPNALNASKFERYGVRVPALVMSPYIPAGRISHTIYDHTSILKTILNRFCKRPDGSIPHMSRRVDDAADLEPLLSLTTARTDCKPAPMIMVDESTHVPAHFKMKAGLETLGPLSTTDVDLSTPEMGTLEPTDLQREILALRDEALKLGVPKDQL